METKEILKDLRKQRGFSAKQVAEGCEMSLGVYQKYESGERGVGTPALVKFADFYGVTTDYLLGREQTDEQPKPTQAEQEQELLETYFRLEPQKRAMFLEMLLGIVKNGGITKSGKTIPVLTAARAAPGGEHEPPGEEEMTPEEIAELFNGEDDHSV